jgi:hypothetical protein
MSMISVGILTAFFLSAHAVAARAADALLGWIPFGLTSAIAAVATALAFREIGRGSASTRHKGDFVALATWVIVTGILLLPILPDGFPPHLEWDGANHVAVAGYLVRHRSHAAMHDAAYQLYWGGKLWLQPWGLHALIAALSASLGVHPLFVVYPVVAALAGLVVALVVAWLRSRGVTLAAAALTAGILLLSRMALFHTLHYGYFSQVAGLLLVMATKILLETRKPPDEAPMVAGVLLVGSVCIYPLYAAFVWVGLIGHALVAHSIRPGRLAVTAGSATVITALLTASDAHEVRATLRMGGPRLWPNVADIEFWTTMAVLVVGSTAALRRFGRGFAWPTFGLAAAIAAIVAGAGRLGQYWVAKIAALAFCSTAPMIAVLADEATHRLARGSRRAAVAFQVLALALFVLAYPQHWPTELGRSLTPAEYRTWQWAAAHLPDDKVYVVGSVYKLGLFVRRPA